MNIVYRGEAAQVRLNIYSGGSATDSLSAPSLDILNRAGDVIESPDVTAVSTGVYYAEISPAVTSVSTSILLLWTYELASGTVEKRETLEITVPYVSIEDIYTVAPSTATYDQVKMAEAYARFAIEAYCGQRFYPYYDTTIAYGQGQPVLPLVQRILSLDSITINDDTYTDPADLFGAGVTISASSRALKIGQAADLPSWWSGSAVFQERDRYDITGTFGWDTPPPAVTAAALLLVNDFFCDESTWRNKYVDSISASDWRLTFKDGSVSGTGNATVDKILEPYTSFNWIVI